MGILPLHLSQKNKIVGREGYRIRSILSLPSAFEYAALRNIKMPKVRTIGNCAFRYCEQLTEVELSSHLERIEAGAFEECPRLRRIVIPLKDNLLGDSVFYNDVFYNCDSLSQVDLVEGVHKTISSLLLESWRNDMKNKIDRINRILPTDHNNKTAAIQDFLERTNTRIELYKSKHYALLKTNWCCLNSLFGKPSFTRRRTESS